MGIVSGVSVGAPVINKDESFWGVLGRVECIHEIVNAGLVYRILLGHFIHEDLCASNLVVPAKPEVGVAHIVAVEDLFGQIEILVISSGLVHPQSTPCKLVIVAAPRTKKKMTQKFSFQVINFAYFTHL